ncbi:receptor-like protein kinase HSL1 [Cinnamomum micranthum f. kanehirae]|uniref:non-specific serine/threonine protein kinase n=1 Tax=Cinnamomum micranthum f. kanehirae TaxID=337451 RepID=A0A3S3NJJ0_9MAGN|nr:receptor-like protein kinase HSL1 [Cinnamomum micranthum f. kanehirae]
MELLLLRHLCCCCFFFYFLLKAPLMVVGLNQEGLFLQQMKLSMDDSSQALSNWNPKDSNPCNWFGVTCDTSLSSSVVSLDLTNANLSGGFPTVLCRLPHLSFLSFSYNYLNGSLPSSISTCKSLRHLDLSQNLLVGPLPPSFSSLPNLLYLDLSANNLSGPIPPSFAAFPKLESISLVANLLNGTVPPFLSRVSSLKQLNLSYNPFDPSEIPAEYGNLTQLEILWLANCNLVGSIPPTIGSMKNLTDLDLSLNSLTGVIPDSLTLLVNVVQIELYNNSLYGSLPAGMAGMKSLRRFDASMNRLEGEIPHELCALPLESLNLYENRLEGELPASIAKSPNLYELRLFSNGLSGNLPAELGRNSPLLWVDLSDNLFSGVIPENICGMGALEELLLIGNSLSGGIPASLGDCRSLTRVRLGGNQLSGEVPAGFWGLPHVSLIELSGNSFSGEISPRISSALNLSLLLISNNRFTGMIPTEIGYLGNLVEFSGNDNLLNGSVPATIANLTHLGKLDLHNNQLSGTLPSEIRLLKKLSELNLADNEFSGRIPREIGELPVLNYLDLSGNSLSGEIPIEMQNLKLNSFNLSNNHLWGKIPPLYANALYRESFLGNPGLCSNLIGLCPNPHGGEGRSHSLIWLLRSIFILAGLVLVVGVGCFFKRYWDFKQAKSGSERLKWTLTSFHKLGFSEYEILDCLDEDNVIGTGASGKVYKAILSNGEVVAVKKLWGVVKKGDIEDGYEKKNRVRDDGFEAEVSTLGKIRHKNIVKLWCCCTTSDSKLLVYEYMPNGSLGDLLHSSKGGLLDWPTRLGIALDAAEGLSYLHHDCVPPIVHRDVKSNNILLDGDFGARVADFGVAKMVEAPGSGPNSMSVIAGSCGYIAPEYAYTLRVNEKSDIYSFGVIILELVTGKRPVDPDYGEKDLVKWVYVTLEQKGIDHVIDPKLDICFKEEICKILSIGLLCTSPLPINRPTMRRVVKMLLDIRAEYKRKSEKKGATPPSPYRYEDESNLGNIV